MWRVGFLMGVVACNPGGRAPLSDASNDATIEPADAAADALPPPRNDPGPAEYPVPFDATFGTPAGVFEAETLYAEAIWGDCNPPFWTLRFMPAQTDGNPPSVTFEIRLPPYTGAELTGTIPVTAQYFAWDPFVNHITHSATFEATRLDYPGTGAPRIIGHLVVSDPAWTVDLEIDAHALSGGCI